MCHDHGVPLIVDEAHGGHLGFLHNHPPEGLDHSPSHALNVAALSAGADLVAHSSHKVLTALTQAAMLHMGHGGRVDAARVGRVLQVDGL